MIDLTRGDQSAQDVNTLPVPFDNQGGPNGRTRSARDIIRLSSRKTLSCGYGRWNRNRTEEGLPCRRSTAFAAPPPPPRGGRGTTYLVYVTFFLLTFAVFLPRVEAQPYRAIDLTKDVPIYVEDRTIPTSASISVALTNLSPGADPVMHLLYTGERVGGPQVAFSDDCGGSLAPCINYTNTEAGTEFLIVVYAKNPGTTGTADIAEGANVYIEGIPVAGQLIPAEYIASGPGETLQTAHVPGGSWAEALFAFSDAGRTIISQFGVLNGPANAASIPADGLDYLVGTAYYAERIGNKIVYIEHRAGTIYIYTNDAADTDTDGDGLGDLLEAELSTCPNSPCGTYDYDPRDSDRDGLIDGEEVLGLFGLDADGRDDVDFPRWGANPNHKDVFVEVDYFNNLMDGGNPVGNPFVHLINPDAWVFALRNPYEQGPVQHLRNPDGLPGVSVHLDVGVDSTLLQNEAWFGDYGGLSRHDIGLDWFFRVYGPVVGNITVTVDGVPETFLATPLTDLQTLSLALANSAVAAAGGVGGPIHVLDAAERDDRYGCQTNPPYEAISVVTTNVGAPTVDIQITLPQGYEDAVQLRRENDCNEALWKRYYYERDVDAVRVRRFRYAVISEWGGGGQTIGSGPMFVAGISDWNNGLSRNSHSFAHELGHTLDLNHDGHRAWGGAPDINCKPNYPSLMSYAFDREGGTFSDIEGMSFYTPSRVPEEDAFGAETDMSFVADPQYPFLFGGTADYVDWDFDGTMDGSPLLRRASKLTDPDQDCDAFTDGAETLPAGPEPAGKVALVKPLEQQLLYLIYTDAEDNNLYYFGAELGSPNITSCTGDDIIEEGDPCLDWTQSTPLDDGGVPPGAPGVSATVWHALSGTDYVVIAYRDAAGGLVANWYTVGANDELVYFENLWLPQYLTDETPAVFHRYGYDSVTTGLIYHHPGSQFRLVDVWPNGFTDYGVLHDFQGQPISGAGSPTVMGLPDLENTAVADYSRTNCGVFRDGTWNLRLFCSDRNSGQWDDWTPANWNARDTLPDSPVDIAYRLQRLSYGGPAEPYYLHTGQLVVAYARPGGELINVAVSGLMDATTFYFGGIVGLSRQTEFGGNWTTYDVAGGVSLLETTLMGGMMAAGVRSGGDSGPDRLEFYPFAAGAHGSELKAASDFRVMEDAICLELVAGPGESCAGDPDICGPTMTCQGGGDYGARCVPVGFPDCGTSNVLD